MPSCSHSLILQTFIECRPHRACHSVGTQRIYMLGVLSGTALPWRPALLLSTLPGKKSPIGHGLGCLQLPSGHKATSDMFLYRYLYSIWTSTVWPYFFYNKTKQNKIERSLVFKPIILKLNFYFSHPWLPTWITLGMFKDGCWVPHTAHAISLARVLGIFRTPRWFEHVAKLKSTRQRRDRGKKASGSWMGAALSRFAFCGPACVSRWGEDSDSPCPEPLAPRAQDVCVFLAALASGYPPLPGTHYCHLWAR